MRLWSGAQFSTGHDVVGPALIVSGAEDLTQRTLGSEWTLGSVTAEGDRVWRPTVPGALERLGPPYDDDLAKRIADSIAGPNPTRLHPALAGDPGDEARRLYPDLADNIDRAFRRFVVYLSEHFGFDPKADAQRATAPYVDGFGPELLVVLGGRPVVLPEVPPVVLAPPSWRDAMWSVSTTMSGPVDDSAVEPEERLSFVGPAPESAAATEGLVYFLAASAMAARAAWERDPDARFLRVLTSVILAGYRPWSERSTG